MDLELIPSEATHQVLDTLPMSLIEVVIPGFVSWSSAHARVNFGASLAKNQRLSRLAAPADASGPVYGYVRCHVAEVAADAEPEAVHVGTGVGPLVLTTTLPRPFGSTRAIVTGCVGGLPHQLLQTTLA